LLAPGILTLWSVLEVNQRQTHRQTYRSQAQKQYLPQLVTVRGVISTVNTVAEVKFR